MDKKAEPTFGISAPALMSAASSDFIGKTVVRTMPVIIDLPPEIAAGVGQIMAATSYNDYLMQQIINTLLGIDIKQGRIAAGQPRGKDAITRMENLIHLKGLDIDVAPLRQNLTTIEQERDMVGHGVWGKHELTGNIYVQRTSGKWQPPEKTETVSRRIEPQGVLITVDYLKNIISKVKAQITLTDEYRQKIKAAVLALQQKQNEQVPRGGLPQDQTPNTP
jgi:hypothetical protein